MTDITIKVLHGADRGKVFHALNPPLTIGREEGNTIQLNDERVSRCHFKIQRDNDRLVLTDLDSTNGTKVNGSECQLKILRHGDLIAVGRTVMLLGSEEQIAARIAAITGGGTDGPTMEQDPNGAESSLLVDLKAAQVSPQPHYAALRTLQPPGLPERLTPGQSAQLSEILEFVANRIHRLIEGAKVDDAAGAVALELEKWQQLLEAQSHLATLIRKISDP